MSGQELFTQLVTSDNGVIAMLAAIVGILAGVIVIQWNFTQKKTVPKWIWERMVDQTQENASLLNKIIILMDERLKK